MQTTCVNCAHPSRAAALWAFGIVLAALLAPGLRAAEADSPLRRSILDQDLSSPASPVELPVVTVVGQLDAARQRIVPNSGATVYSIGRDQIEALSQGDNIPLSKLVLRFPGVSQDDGPDGGFHIRDEHGNVQYRINDVLIPEGITGFGSEFDLRFADRVDLITGALPSQYGFRNTGVLDIHTKSGAFDRGGDVEMYGGSYETVQPSFQYGGSQGKWNYFLSGSYLQDTEGIENPLDTAYANHDDTQQTRGFLYASYVVDDSSRLSLIAGQAHNHYQVPNQLGDSGGNGFDPAVTGLPATFDSAGLRNTQDEQNNYEVLAYQKTIDDFDFQLALFNRYSNVSYRPDIVGDLYNDGVAGRLDRSLMSQGAQFDASYQLTEAHTLRGGLMLDAQGSQQKSLTYAYVLDPGTGLPAGPAAGIPVGSYETAYLYGFYLQDEWKITPRWSVNFGGRFDLYQNAQVSQNQLSPRVNSTYQLDQDTAFHAGYASYFTPPSLENAPADTVAAFAGTNNAAADLPNDPVKAERSHYFDAGVVHKFTPEYQVGLDGYYKIAQNQIDDGQFGAAPILSEFNYRRAEIYGVEVSQSYKKGGFDAYANFAVEQARGTGVNSAQALLFDGPTYDYIASHTIYLDHSQTFTGSVGASYLVNETQPYLEVLCGSGLRADGVDDSGTPVPNGSAVDAYDTVNIGFQQTFKFAGAPRLKARFDVVNLFDQQYFLRTDGVGVFTGQAGARRGFYGGLTYSF